MSEILKLQKKEIDAKKLEFRRLALSSYGSYLNEMHKMSCKDPSKAQYSAFLLEEIKLNKQEIEEVDKKLFLIV